MVGSGGGATRYGGGALRGLRGRAPGGRGNLAIYGKNPSGRYHGPSVRVGIWLDKWIDDTRIRAPIEGTGGCGTSTFLDAEGVREPFHQQQGRGRWSKGDGNDVPPLLTEAPYTHMLPWREKPTEAVYKYKITHSHSHMLPHGVESYMMWMSFPSWVRRGTSQ